MKAALILLAVVLLGAGLFMVDRSLSQQALAVAVDGKYQIVAEGWTIVKAAWPLVFLAFVLVLAVTVPVLYLMASKAVDAMEKESRAVYERKTTTLEAETKKRNDEFKAKLANLTEREAKLARDIEELKQAKVQITTYVQDVNEKANDAERRRVNAAAAAERRRRKIEKLQITPS
jgi:septal ring factor EnvC (AmiA/AmiB activator)